MSMSTVVVIVIAMAFLILGLVLVRNIFTGATGATDLINDNVRAQIEELFLSDTTARTIIFAPDNEADVPRGETKAMDIAIRNTATLESEESTFSYEILVDSVERGCQFTDSAAQNLITLGEDGEFPIAPGRVAERKVNIRVPDDAPTCKVSFNLIVRKDGQSYDTNQFYVNMQ